MAVHAMTELTRFGFALGVLFTVIGTRMPFDPSYGTIGGSLSYPFRVLLLSSCIAKALRNFGQDVLPFWSFLWPILYVVDGCLMTWLFMATPYLLRSFMKDRIFVVGRPLQAWLIGLSLTQATGLISSIAFADDRIWALIRLAGAASTIPVLQALQQYNQLTTPTGPYRGRGMAVTQALARYERFFQLVMVIAAIGDFYQVGASNPSTNVDDLYKHRSMLQFYWLRAALHGLFINMLDEMEQVVSVTTPDPNEDNRDEPDGEKSTACIPSPVSGRSH